MFITIFSMSTDLISTLLITSTNLVLISTPQLFNTRVSSYISRFTNNFSNISTKLGTITITSRLKIPIKGISSI